MLSSEQVLFKFDLRTLFIPADVPQDLDANKAQGKKCRR